VDRVKAAAILAVIANHALPLLASGGGVPWQEAFRWLVQFHVPSFLLVSGLLYARAGLRDGTVVRRRLERVLVPYLVASLVMEASGLAGATSGRDAFFQILTGGALPIYYNVYLLTLSILATALLSRLGEGAPRIACAALWLYLVAAALFPSLWSVPTSFYWAMRNPRNFYGYFLLGWIAAGSWPRIRHELERRPWRVRLACAVAVVTYAAFHALGRPGPPALQVLCRAVYTVAIVALLAAGPARRAPTRPVALLSRSTYGMFLYHLPFLRLLDGAVADWSPVPRTAALFAAGLTGGAVVCAVGAWILGPRAATILGVPAPPRPRDAEWTARPPAIA
jgi:peptidoglycan/LPS O-acetylase OafA/YrhL